MPYSALARAMVTEYGMSDELGFQTFGPDDSKQPWEQPDKVYSEATAKLIDVEVKALIDRTYGEAASLLSEKRDELDRLAQALLKYETLTREEVTRVLAGETLEKATVADLLEAEKQKRLAEAAAAEAAKLAGDGDGDAEEKIDEGDAPAAGAMPAPA